MNNNKRIADALAAATDTAALEIGTDILDRVPSMFAEQFPDKRALVVADENTWRAAGEANRISRRQESDATNRTYSPIRTCMPSGASSKCSTRVWRPPTP